MADRRPGDDRPVASDDSLTVLTAIRECYREAEEAKRTRQWKNEQNFRAYHGEQDWRHKTKGQSREFLPKVPMAIEQFAAFVKRALVGFGEWFDVDVPTDGPLTAEDIKKLIVCKLERHQPDFATVISDAVKVGALGSLMILKIHGRVATRTRYKVERGLELATVGGMMAPRVTESLGMKKLRRWECCIDLVRPQDYFPDPTGRRLYEIHEVERDLSDVVAWAEAGIYDREAVAQIAEDFRTEENEQQAALERGQDVAGKPSFRKQVRIREFHGTLLGSDGRVVAENVVCAMANDKYLIRKPTPNKTWHGESPFVACPLIRVPFSVWHKALADHMTALNIAENELYNLMLDGGIGSVWGVRQLHANWLENPKDIADGIPQGATLQVNDQCPVGAKVLETVTTGAVPPEALQMFMATEKEFQGAALGNELTMGLLPPKQVKATEVVEASNSRGITLDGIVRDVENNLIRPALRKLWLTTLQYAEDLDEDEVIGAIGPRAALALSRMSPAERFSRYNGCKFKVYGLSAVLARGRDFSKYAAVLGMVSTNPLMMQAYVKRYSLDKTLDTILKLLNIDPTTLQVTPEEQAALMSRLQELPMFMQLAGVKQQGGSGLSAQDTGDASLPAEINTNMTNPLAVMGKA